MAPQDASIALNLGLLLQHLKRVKEAEKFIRTALALQPTYAEASDALGLLLAADGRYAEAEVAYLQAIRNDPQAAWYSHLGFLYYKVQNWEKAEASYVAASQLGSANAADRSALVLIRKRRPARVAQRS